MSSIIWCDRAPYHVDMSVSEVVAAIEDAPRNGSAWFIVPGRTSSSDQSAVRLSAITGVTPAPHTTGSTHDRPR